MKSFRTKEKKGGALITVIILVTVLLVIVATILKSAHEAKLINHRQALWIEAKNAAESALEYGLADLSQRMVQNVALPRNEMSSGVRPLTLPASASTFLASGSVALADVSVVGAPVLAGSSRYVDPTDEANTRDPLQGTTPFVREIEIYGQATARSPFRGGNVTAYCMEKLQVRDVALFSHAVFYNMDMDIQVGPRMDIHGPVHANYDLYATSNNGVYFHQGVSVAGKAYRHLSWTPTTPPAGAVYATSAPSTFVEWPADKDSDSADWEAYAANRWNGRVQTGVHGVRKINPVGLPPYVPDDLATTSIDEMRNYAYAMIEPQLGTAVAYDKDHKGEGLEAQKFSARAGLIIRITDITQPNGWRLYRYQTPNTTVPVSTQPIGNNLPVRDATTGLPNEIEIPKTAELEACIINKAYAQTGSGTSAVVTSGLYDRREGLTTWANGEKHIVEIDIGKLRKTVDDHAPGYATDADGKAAWGGNYDPPIHFNGIVYVEMPLVIPRGSVAHTSRPDKIRTSLRKYGLMLNNGQDIPNPSWNPAAGREAGFTIATNGPVYIRGHYNSDGNSGTGSSSTPDAKTTATAEVPAAIVGDAIMVLSPSFDARYSAQTPSNASFCEVSAAFLAGMVPTESAGAKGHGGMNNFTRFLENWSGLTLRYRGSIVSLFESEINNHPWDEDNLSYWYRPPTRDYGFHSFFAAANFPPGSPFVRDTRRIDFRDMTKAEYDAAIAGLSY